MTDSPGSTSLRTQKRLCPLHVIARSEATGQSVTPAAVHGRKQRLRQIRKASRICPNSSQLAKFPCGENGLPHLGDTSCASFAPAFPEENPGLKSLRCIAFSGPHRCAPVPILHWFAMTCRRKGACAGARTFGAQGAQNAGTCQREHGRFSAVHRQCPGILRTRSKFLHVIARSEATWQSVTPAAVHGRKQRLRRIRKASRICPNSSQLAKFPCGENGLPRQCAHWLAMTCRRQWRVCGCKDLPHCHCEERSGGTIRTLCGRA